VIEIVDYLISRWRDIELLTLKLASKLVDEGYIPEVLVGILRGGWIVARLLSDYLGIDYIGSVEIKFYKGIEDRHEKPVLTQPLVINVRDRSVLIVDDVADSGKTLQLATDLLRLYGPKEVKTASLYVKPRSIITPDYFVLKTDKWIIFPWEIAETLRNVIKSRGVKASVENILKTSVELGITVDDFLSELAELISKTSMHHVGS